MTKRVILNCKQPGCATKKGIKTKKLQYREVIFENLKNMFVQIQNDIR